MIQFLKYTKLYVLISSFVIGVGIYTLLTRGVTYSIDFTGGSVIEYRLEKPVTLDDAKSIFKSEKIKTLELSIAQDVLSSRTNPLTEVQESTLRTALTKKSGKISVLKFDTVGPSLGIETIRKTIIASVVAILGILLYVSYTFKKFSYGMAAVLAMGHDFMVLIGTYALLGHLGAQVDALFVTALLTTMSFSVHDTIVVFDKIREYRRTSGLPIDVLANKALTETMVRSLNNSFTIVLMLIPLTFMGGDAIKFFAGALLIGTITGTYSSPFVATPLLVWFEGRKK